jgi:beta-N-acetylhexosaminidase
MTAHIVYEDIDNNNPATLSKKLINELIRKQLNFKGLLMSDDICMKALKGSAQTLANKCFTAGCDIVLHCNGDYNQMLSLLESVRPASSSLLAKIIKLFNYTR